MCLDNYLRIRSGQEELSEVAHVEECSALATRVRLCPDNVKVRGIPKRVLLVQTVPSKCST